MKKDYLLYLFFCLTITANAQWNPFPLEQKSFYEYQNTQETTINICFHDSIVNYGAYQVFHFDYSTPGYNGCYQPLNNDPDIIKFSYTDPFRPDSVISQNDTLLFAYTHGSNFQLTTDSILFLPNTPKDSSWFTTIDNVNYNQLKFTCDSIYLDTIIGNIVDSVKLFSIRAYNNSNFVSSGFDTKKLFFLKTMDLNNLFLFIKMQQLLLLGLIL